ncbi:hypothetical protein V1515DRAFT_51627 [Lipomyces mesembrius]
MSFFCSLSARLAEFMSMGDRTSLPHSSERSQGSVILIWYILLTMTSQAIAVAIRIMLTLKTLRRSFCVERVGWIFVIFSSAHNEEQTIRFVLPTRISTSKQYGSQAEVVKAKLTTLLDCHRAENVFVNTTNPGMSKWISNMMDAGSTSCPIIIPPRLCLLHLSLWQQGPHHCSSLLSFQNVEYDLVVFLFGAPGVIFACFRYY